MDSDINIELTAHLKELHRISTVSEGVNYPDDVLLFPENIDFVVDNNCNVRTIGFDKSKDIKAKDLLRIIEVEDAEHIRYKETNVLSPSVYVHSLEEKPWHITTQGFLVSHLNSTIRSYVRDEANRLASVYGKHELDQFWLPCSKPLDDITDNDLVCVFNRRVSGWDGSIERPVVELLGAGGHLQAVWNEKEQRFMNRTFENNLRKEFDEEIGLAVTDSDIHCVGGFANDKTQELVVFSCIYIDDTKIPDIQNYALNNYAEDTNGIYLGSFKETIKYYRQNPALFAGGEKAAKTNFPNNRFIIRKICELYSISDML